jgi:cytochrome b561
MSCPDPQAPPASRELRYTRGAMVLHWIMAVLILAVGVLGLLQRMWPVPGARSRP